MYPPSLFENDFFVVQLDFVGVTGSSGRTYDDVMQVSELAVFQAVMQSRLVLVDPRHDPASVGGVHVRFDRWRVGFAVDGEFFASAIEAEKDRPHDAIASREYREDSVESFSRKMSLAEFAWVGFRISFVPLGDCRVEWLIGGHFCVDFLARVLLGEDRRVKGA